MIAACDLYGFSIAPGVQRPVFAVGRERLADEMEYLDFGTIFFLWSRS